jgi:segregation and condensation protein B
VDHEQRKKIVEALIIAAPTPVSAAKLANIVPRLTPAKAREIVEELRGEYEQENRAFEIWNVSGGYQIRTRGEFSGYIKQLQPERPLRLSRAALETLSIIAYRQPVTRAEIEQVRGVDAGAVVRSLLDRALVRTAGHREVPGRPMLYTTAPRFLEVFGLKNLKDLPTLRDLEDLGGEADLGSPGPAAIGDESEAPAVGAELH